MNRRAIGVVLILMISALLCSWLASVLFLSLALRKLTNVGPWTIYHYTSLYKSAPKIRDLITLSWLVSGVSTLSLLTLVFQKTKGKPVWRCALGHRMGCSQSGLA